MSLTNIINCVFVRIDFINDNILDDMTCAKKIQVQHGFKVWPKYETSCKGENLKFWIDDVNKCLNGPSLIRTSFNEEGEEPFDDTNSLYSDKSDRSAAQWNSKTSNSLLNLLSSFMTILYLRKI